MKINNVTSCFGNKKTGPSLKRLAFEKEIRRHLTWRIVFLSIGQLSLLVFLMYVLYCLIQHNHQWIEELLKQNREKAIKIHALELELHKHMEECNQCKQ